MPGENSDEQKLNDLLLRDDRYKKEAYRFIQEALEYTRRKLGRRGHISGKELSKGVRDLALDRFGMLAKTVLNQWGIRETIDIGNLVFNLVDAEIMIKQDSDTHEDFTNVYDMDEALTKNFKLIIEE